MSEWTSRHQTNPRHHLKWWYTVTNRSESSNGSASYSPFNISEAVSSISCPNGRPRGGNNNIHTLKMCLVVAPRMQSIQREPQQLSNMRGMYCLMVLCMTIQLSIAACNLSVFRTIDSFCTDATLTGTIPTASVSLTWSGTSSLNSLTLTSSSPSNTNSITVTINNIKQIYFQNLNWGGSNNYLNTDGNITLLSITSSIVTNTRFTIPSSSNIAWNITGSQFTGVSFIENQSSCSSVSISNSTLRTNSLQYVNPSCDVSIQSSTIVNHAFIINLPGQNILVQGGINGRSILRSSSIKRSPASSSGQPDGGIIMVSDTDFYDNILYYPALYAGNITVVGSAFRSQGTTTNNALINAIYTSVSGCQFFNVTFPLGTLLSDHIYVQSSTFDSCTTKVGNTGNTQDFTVIWSGFELTMIDSMVTNTNVNNSNWMNVPGAVFSFNVRMNNCTFNNNYGNMGAAVYGQHLNMTSCTFQNNVASQLGGAVFVMNTGDLIDVNSTYINNFVNSSIGAGGAIYSQNNASTLYHSSFQSNSATYGSAINTVGARLYNCTFSNHRNIGPIGYGVISGTKNVIATGCTYVSNAVPAIFGGSTTLVNIQSCNFRENSNGDLSGSVIDVNGGYVQATYTVFSGNNVTDVIRAGSVTLGYVDIIGDIFNSSAVTVTSGGSIYNCHFYANGSIGYSITSSGGVNITDCIFSEFSSGLQLHYGDHRLMRSTFTPDTPLMHLDDGGTLTSDNITLLCFIRTPDNSRHLIYNAPDTASYVSMATFDCTFSSSIIPTTSTTLEISTISTPNDITPAEALHFITKNATLPWTAIYNTLSQLFSNPASNATLTLSLPSLSLSAYDLTRYHTDTL
ncbi:adhesin-like protein, partial [Planoprotostelium fungivorum]